MDTIHKVLKELETWERDVVYPLALKRVELDLDDGVKVNYGKLGAVLERVKGLNG
jgi:energy-converting hydrogenase A subunit M